MLDMINTFRKNQRLIKRRSYYEVYKRKYNEAGITPTRIRKATPEQLAAARAKASAFRKRERILRLIALAVSILFTALIIACIVRMSAQIAARAEKMPRIELSSTASKTEQNAGSCSRYGFAQLMPRSSYPN